MFNAKHTQLEDGKEILNFPDGNHVLVNMFSLTVGGQIGCDGLGIQEVSWTTNHFTDYFGDPQDCQRGTDFF